MDCRATSWDFADQEVFDVLIVGGGVNGASLYSDLCRHGWRTLLLDSSDFGSGSSQASAMMVWGGLLYLLVGDLPTVYRLSRARDRMIKEMDAWARPEMCRYIPSRRSSMPSAFIGAGLGLYWLLGAGRRRMPHYERRFDESTLILPGEHRGAFCFEEAVLRSSDARFALHWITHHAPPAGAAINYCELESADFDGRQRLWRLALRDRLNGRNIAARARLVVNATGIWADRLNERFGIQSPYRHAFSKGVFLGLALEDGHRVPLVFDMGSHSDVIGYMPWGPVALWGPTETAVDTIEEGLEPNAMDLRFLLETAKRHLHREVQPRDIVSLRCGVRALAVKRGYVAERYPLELSRRSIVCSDPGRPWISIYGGKLTGCRELAASIRHTIASRVSGSLVPRQQSTAADSEIESIRFPGIERSLPSPAWCRRHEYCCTVEDYLRRRTNISQWVSGQGLGHNKEHRDAVLAVARALHDGEAEAALARYERQVDKQYSQLLANQAAAC